MPTQTTLQIAGMHCGHCAQRVGQSLDRLDGVIRAEVDAAGTATVRFDEDRVSEDELRDTVRMAGFDLA